MTFSMYILLETIGEDFDKGKSYKIIFKKAIDKKVE